MNGRIRKAIGPPALMGLIFLSIGLWLGVADGRALYLEAPQLDATLLRYERGFGWSVPIYRVSCAPGFEELSGSKHSLGDGDNLPPGTPVKVACGSDLRARSRADFLADLHRDGVFVVFGILILAVRVRRARVEK